MSDKYGLAHAMAMVNRFVINQGIQFLLYGICFIIYGFYLDSNYKEIVHFNDSAVYVFYMDYEKFFFTPHHRYVAVLTQYLPLLVNIGGGGFIAFVKSYVLNGLISTILLYVIYGFLTKKWENGWIFVLCLLIGYQYSFFYLVPEHFAYTLSIFFVLLYFHIADFLERKVFLLFSALVGLLMAGSHLYALIIILTGFVYLFFINNSLDGKRQIIYHGMMVISVYMCIKLCIPHSGYEMEKLAMLKQNLNYIETLDKAAFRYVFYRDQRYALDFNVLAICLLIIVLYTRKFFLGILTIGLFFFTFYLNCLYSYSWQATEYMELYGRLIFFCLLVALIALSANAKVNQLFFCGLCVLCFISFYHKTSLVNWEYSKRYKAIYQLTSTRKNDKIYIQNDSLLVDKLWFTWAIPHESMLISTLEGETKTAYIYNGGNLRYEDVRLTFFTGSMQKFDKAQLQKTYFKSLDTLEYQFQLN